MLVEAQVSSTKTSRRGSRPGCILRQLARAASTSALHCSAARRVFFEGQLQALHEAPDRRASHLDAERRQLSPELRDGHIGLFGHQPPHLVFETDQRRPLVSAELARRIIAGRFVTAHELDHATRADLKDPSYFMPAPARLNRPNHALPQIPRIGLRHPCWPPSQPTWSIMIRPLLRISPTDSAYSGPALMFTQQSVMRPAGPTSRHCELTSFRR